MRYLEKIDKDTIKVTTISYEKIRALEETIIEPEVEEIPTSKDMTPEQRYAIEEYNHRAKAPNMDFLKDKVANMKKMKKGVKYKKDYVTELTEKDIDGDYLK